jgi:hypothetical protein
VSAAVSAVGLESKASEVAQATRKRFKVCLLMVFADFENLAMLGCAELSNVRAFLFPIVFS